MSGRATGWVLRNGPHPDHVGTDGRKYGQRARGLRSVLLAVADAANSDGENAYPGLANVCTASLYSRRQAQQLLGDLVADGWLEITGNADGGRGHATVYRVIFTSHPVTGKSAVATPPAAAAKGATTRVERVRSPPIKGAVQTAPQQVLPTGTSNGDGVASAPPDPGREIARKVWEASDPKPATKFIAVAKIASAFLEAGWSPDAIERAMLAVPTISTHWLEVELNRTAKPAGARTQAPVITDRDRPSGEITL